MEIPVSSNKFAEYLRKLRQKRLSIQHLQKGLKKKRHPLAKADRKIILEKTNGRCHICGGRVGERWQADHVLAHSAGGAHSAANYLPAHPTCNNYRWNYLPEEFELILKLGVWIRTQIEKETKVGKECGNAFLAYERNREKRKERNS
jgi:hypothetical protein